MKDGMMGNDYLKIAIIFYCMQVFFIACCFLTIAPLKKNTKKNYWLYVLTCCFLNTLQFILFDGNYFMKTISFGIINVGMSHMFCTKSIWRKIFLYIIIVHMLLFLEIFVLGGLVVFLHIEMSTAMSSSNIIFINIVSIFCIIIMLMCLTNYLQRKEAKIKTHSLSYLSLLAMSQCFTVLMIFSGYSKSYAKQEIFLLIGVIIISYILVHFVINAMYKEIKYKENTIFLLEQYDAQLQDYLKLKDMEEDIQYLRHEIINQILSMEKLRSTKNYESIDK